MRYLAYATTFTSFFFLYILAFSQDPVPGACGIVGPNLISNGEFDAGNTGFTSDYNFFPNKICNFGDYTVTSGVFYDPIDNCFGDPTFNLQTIWAAEDRNSPGVGNFMIVDPAAANGVTDRIWEQSVTVCPNTEYVFSIFGKNVYFLEAASYSGVDPTFNFTINGVEITDLYVDGAFTGSSVVDLPRQPQSEAGVWKQISGRWNSGSNTTALITMNNLVGVEQGNDLAIDGAFFGRCGKANEVEISAGALSQCVAEGTVEPITLVATPETNSSNWAYHEWLKDGVVAQADNSNPIPPYTPAANGDGTYFADYELRVYDDPLGLTCASVSETLSFQEDCQTIFPVEWLSFEAKVQRQGVMLTWTTGSELNNQGFEVEVSVDGQLFRKIGWVHGVGNSSEASSYHFLADNLLRGDSYFRLKQVDYDGAFEYSSIVQASFVSDLAYTLSIAPNPMQEVSYFRLELDQDVEDVRMDIFDSSGRLVREYYKGPLEGQRLYQFPFKKEDLLPGLYFLRIQHNQFIGTKTFLISN
ncbi:MAG: T9SS type A sorting domain-containing protein [Bacteroidota bacterium]